jgi:hypothetical protein
LLHILHLETEHFLWMVVTNDDDLFDRLETESVAMLPPFGPIEGHKWFSRFPANESLRRTGLDRSISAKSSFYPPAFEICRSCLTASVRFFRLCTGEGDMGRGNTETRGLKARVLPWLSSCLD